MSSVAVVIPVLNRERGLRRSLESVRRQTFGDWECIVVDDASTVDLRAVVTAFDDPRIRYVRRDETGGPARARVAAWRLASSDYLLNLDSDWELYPWALTQGVAYLESTPEVDVATGLCLRNEDSRLFVRVRDAPRIETPTQFRAQEVAPDRVAMVRADVVREWLTLPGDYFAFESALWMSTSLSRSTLGLDEPWVLYHTSGTDRVTAAGSGRVGRQRHLDDAITFLRERDDLISGGPCVAVDRALEDILFTLSRARAPQATMAADTLVRRGVSPRRALARQVVMRARGKIQRGEPPVFWV
jgi:glycosyltransferase involved in cell wall biosynthesis